MRAFENLRQRGLRDVAGLEKLNELGELIRAYLIEPFRRAHLKQLFDKGTSNPLSKERLAGTPEQGRRR